VFNGLRTQAEVSAALAKVNELKQSKLLLQDGLGLQVKSTLVGLEAAQKAQEASMKARDAARQNLDLNTRAYESELIDTDKLTKAQLMEALMSAQFLKAQYECARLRSQLELLVGTDLQSRLETKR
jgi:outer membrane protein